MTDWREALAVDGGGGGGFWMVSGCVSGVGIHPFASSGFTA